MITRRKSPEKVAGVEIVQANGAISGGGFGVELEFGEVGLELIGGITGGWGGGGWATAAAVKGCGAGEEEVEEEDGSEAEEEEEERED